MNTFADKSYPEAVATSERSFISPFPDTEEQYVHEQNFIQDSTRFRPLRLGTVDPDYPQSYLIAESPRIPVGKNLLTWTRRYSRIPVRRVIYESYVYTLPGISTESIYTPRFVDNGSSRNVVGGTLIVTQSAHGLSVGDAVQISATIQTGDVQQTVEFRKRVLSLSGINGFIVDTITDGDPSYNTVRKLESGRDPINRVVGSFVAADYFLPGLPGQPSSAARIEILRPTVIIDSVGKETNSYALNTTPTKASYLLQVASGVNVIAEASVIRLWEGPIYERQTRYVRAE